MKTMPIEKKWSPATEASIKNKTPADSGIYELHSFGEIVYVGESKNLRRRLLEHLNERNPNKFRYKTTGFFDSRHKLEKKHYDRATQKLGHEPRWNSQSP